jgi:hypothetical protein
MSNYLRQSFKTLLTGNPNIDNYQVENDQTIRTSLPLFSGSNYNFDFITSRYADTVLQLQASGSLVNPGTYTGDIAFDYSGIAAMTTGSFVSIKVETPQKTVDVRFGNYASLPTFRDYYIVPRPTEITVVGVAGNSTEEIFSNSIAGILQRELPAYRIESTSPSGSIIVSAINPGGTQNALITATDATGSASSIVTVNNTTALFEAYDDQCIDVYGDFNVAMDIDASVSNGLGDSQRFLATLLKSYNKSHTYVFNARDVLNKMLPAYNLLDQKDGNINNGSLTILNGQIEPTPEVNLVLKMIANELEYSENIEFKLRVIDGKWTTLSDNRLFDYFHDKMLNIDPAQDESESFIRFYVDISTPFTGSDITVEYSNVAGATFLFTATTGSTADEKVNYTQNLTGILNDISTDYLSYVNNEFITQLGESGMRISVRSAELSSTFGYVEFHVFTPTGDNDTNLIDFSNTVTAPAGEDLIRVYPQATIALPNTQTGWVSETDYQVKRLLNNYRTEDSPNYFQNVYQYTDWTFDNGLLEKLNETEVIDVYVNSNGNYASSAFISFPTLWPGSKLGEDVGVETLSTRLSLSRVLIQNENGNEYFSTILQGQIFEDFNVIATPILDDEFLNRTEGIAHINIAPYVINSDVLVSPYQFPNGSEILNTSLTFNVDLVVTNTLTYRVPLTTPVKLNIIRVAENERVHELAYKTSLGGFSSLSFVGDMTEVLENEVETSTREQFTTDNTIYNDGDNTITTLYAQYFNHYIASRTVESNDTTAKYRLQYRTSNKQEYQRLRDLVESEKIYYRLYDRENAPGQYIWAEISATFSYDYSGIDYTLDIEFEFLNPSGNILRLEQDTR